MRVARVEVNGVVRAAVVSADAESVQVLPADVSVLDLLGQDRDALVARAERAVPIGAVRLLAPLVPASIRDFSVFEQHNLGMQRNFRPLEKLADSWYEDAPLYYTGYTGSVSGPGDEIPVPPGCVDFDLEIEVAAVIGRSGFHLSPQEGESCIAGYTIFNDWSARDILFADMKFGFGAPKGKDSANTLGPWIVTADELAAYRVGDALDLDMRVTINGRELGHDTLAKMAWSYGELVSHASRGTWVRPGDLIASGTCGYGCLAEFWGNLGDQGRKEYPPLKAGDEVSLSVQGIGTLENTVVAPVAQLSPLPKARRGGLLAQAQA